MYLITFSIFLVTDSCASASCQYKSHCISIPDLTYKCVCKMCTGDPSPVCASNGQTYLTKCHVEYFSCVNKKEIEMIEEKGCGE